MKRVLTVASSLVLATTCLWVSTAASQETTTTTEVAVTTTTEAPAVTTTTAAPEETTTTIADPEVTTTTAAPEETTTTVPEEPLVLPGQHVTAGQLAFDIRFTDSPAANCTKTLDLAGGQVNIGLDESGNIGGVYGLAPSGGGTAGVFMIGLGAVPAGVGILSVSDGDCEFDAVGIGSYASDGGWARINGVGAGLHPGYETPDYVNMFLVDAKVSASAAPAVLDMNSVKDLLLRQRPGLEGQLPPEA